MSEPLGKNYRLLWLSSAVANLGDGIGVVAWPWLASLLTRDPLAIALVAVALRLPWFLFSLPAGVITDRHDRRKLVLVMDILRSVALFMLSLAVWHALPIQTVTGLPDAMLYWLLLSSALLIGFAEVLRDNAAQTLMPSLVPKSRLEAANGRLWSIEVLMNSLIGPPLAGLVIAVAVPAAFVFNGAGFALSAAMILLIRGNFRPAPRPRQPLKTEFKQGFSFLWRNPLLRDLALGLGLMNATYQMMMVGLILFSQDVLGLSAPQYGLLLTAGAVGGIIGGILSERVIGWLGAGLTLRLCLLALITQMVVAALANNAWPIWIALCVGEFMAMIWNTITVTLRQRLIPEDLLGRVNSVYRFFGWGLMPLGLLASGAVVKFSGGLPHDMALRTPFALGAVLMAVLTLRIWRKLSNRALADATFR